MYEKLGSIAVWVAGIATTWFAGLAIAGGDTALVNTFDGLVLSAVMFGGALMVKLFMRWVESRNIGWLAPVISQGIGAVEELYGAGMGTQKKSDVLAIVRGWIEKLNLPMPWFIPQAMVRSILLSLASTMINEGVDFLNEHVWKRTAAV